MGLGKFFSRILGGGGDSATPAVAEEPVEYKGFMITAAPLNEGGQFRTAGTIAKLIDGEHKAVQFIRADNHSDRDSAVSHSERKAQQIVDEQGEAIFQRDHI